MGYDDFPPPRSNETAEITIEVDGAVDKAEFEKFKKELKDCLAKLAATQGGKGAAFVRVGIRKRR